MRFLAESFHNHGEEQHKLLDCSKVPKVFYIAVVPNTLQDSGLHVTLLQNNEFDTECNDNTY